jgi:hypothetical protein
MGLPALFAAGTIGSIFGTFAKFFIASAILRVVTSFGIGLVVFTSFDLIITKVQQLLASLVFDGDSLIIGALDAGGVFDAVNIILSAYVAVLTIKALFGAFTRLTFGSGS